MPAQATPHRTDHSATRMLNDIVVSVLLPAARGDHAHG